MHYCHHHFFARHMPQHWTSFRFDLTRLPIRIWAQKMSQACRNSLFPMSRGIPPRSATSVAGLLESQIYDKAWQLRIMCLTRHAQDVVLVVALPDSEWCSIPSWTAICPQRTRRKHWACLLLASPESINRTVLSSGLASLLCNSLVQVAEVLCSTTVHDQALRLVSLQQVSDR